MLRCRYPISSLILPLHTLYCTCTVVLHLRSYVMQLWTMSSLGKTKLAWGNKGILVGQVGIRRISPTTIFHTLYFHISTLHRIAKYNCPFNPWHSWTKPYINQKIFFLVISNKSNLNTQSCVQWYPFLFFIEKKTKQNNTFAYYSSISIV